MSAAQPEPHHPRPSESPIAVVTGASSGIGAETALGLARAGRRVILCGRDAARTSEVASRIERAYPGQVLATLLANFSRLSDVARLADDILALTPRLDLLVNNAGLWHPKRTLSQDGYEDTFAVNHLAPFCLTTRLLPLLCATRAGVSKADEASSARPDGAFVREPNGTGSTGTDVAIVRESDSSGSIEGGWTAPHPAGASSGAALGALSKAPPSSAPSTLSAAPPAPDVRVVTVSSRLHNAVPRFPFNDVMSERGYVGLTAYAQSKLANVLFAAELARRLKPTGVTSNSVHPGSVATQVVRDSWWLSLGARLPLPMLKSPEEGATTSLHVATAPELVGVTGCYFAHRQANVPSSAARDRQAAAQLWALSEDLVARAVG